MDALPNLTPILVHPGDVIEPHPVLVAICDPPTCQEVEDAANQANTSFAAWRSIIVDTQRRIVFGWPLVKASRVNRRPFHVMQIEADELAIERYIITKHLNWVSLNKSQRALTATKLLSLDSDRGRKRQGHALTAPGKSLSPDNEKVFSEPWEAAQRAADLLGVSKSMVYQAKRLTEGLVPELLVMIRTGDLTVTAAAPLLKLSQDEQTALSMGGVEAVRSHLKRLRKKGGKRRKCSHSNQKRWSQVERARGIHLVVVDPLTGEVIYGEDHLQRHQRAFRKQLSGRDIDSMKDINSSKVDLVADEISYLPDSGFNIALSRLSKGGKRMVIP